MRDVGEAVKADVKASLGAVPVYPHERLGAVPQKHAQLYTDSDTPGRRYLAEHRPVLYLHLYAAREPEVHQMYESVRWLEEHVVASYGALTNITYAHNTTTVVQDPDKTWHLRAVYDVAYHRERAGVV